MSVAAALTLIYPACGCIDLAVASDWVLHTLAVEIPPCAVREELEVLLVMCDHQCVILIPAWLTRRQALVTPLILLHVPQLCLVGTILIFPPCRLIHCQFCLIVGVVAVVGGRLAVVVVPARTGGFNV